MEWASEEEKQLHFWFDDLHCPQPISPMYFDAGGWWQTCGYMYRRFGLPFGKDWVAKKVGEYVFTAVVPRDPKEAAEMSAYFNMVMPVYAANFLHTWKHRYLPEILRNFEFLDTYPVDTASLPELMVLLEDALDIQERHFRLHWILNLAQFKSALEFQSLVRTLIGPEHDALVGRILVSDEDRNWDSIRDLWKLKERVAGDPALRSAFKSDTAAGVLETLRISEPGRELLKDLEVYKNEYGNKAIYTHEYVFPTWRENPAPIIEGLRGYVDSDYDYEKDVLQLRANRDAAIAEMWSLFPPTGSPEDRGKLQASLDLARKMAPLTPNHHFYMDQGTYARVRLVFMAIGRKLLAAGVFTQPDDVMFLKYEELRLLSANHSILDANALVKERREARTAAYSVHPPDWVGTITQWSLYEEPYKRNWGWPGVYTKAAERAKQPTGTIKGLGASAGVVEGRARIVHSPEQFDQVLKGDILVCKMTNPAWVLVFTKIAGLVTDAGGALSHPAVIAREFGIPAVVGTGVATRKIVDGQLIRLNGAEGLVELWNSEYRMTNICVSSWSFHNLFTSTRYQGAPGPERDMDILDFPEMIADRYHVHNVEVVSKHFLSTSPAYFAEFRERLRKARSRLVNIPVDIAMLWDQPSISSPDADVRAHALGLYMTWIDYADGLGAQCVRCDPGLLNLYDASATIDSYRKLVAYGLACKISVIVENHGEASAHPHELVKILKASGAGALPDLGNFPDHDTRVSGLKAMFPLARHICHVKVEPAKFDFLECIGIAKDAGFAGVYSVEADDVQMAINELTLCLA